jgi:hypothetical protein
MAVERNRKRMKKNRYIFLIGTLFFLLALFKYVFLSVELETSFVVFEVLSFLVVLFLIYFVLNYIETCTSANKKKGMDKDCIKRSDEIKRLKAKLKQYEQSNSESSIKASEENGLLSDLKANIHPKEESTAKDLLSCLIKRYEIMAGVAYHKVDATYVPVKTFGLEEDFNISSIQEEDGLHAQAIKDNKAMEVEDVPEDYIVGSGSGSSKPLFLYILPLIEKGVVLEIATFKKLNITSVWEQLQTN